MHTTLIACDMSAFGDPRRTRPAHRAMRDTMYTALEYAMDAAGPPWRHCHHEDRGDGALITLPPCTPPANILDPLVHHLHTRLRRSNNLASAQTRVRLRMAVHQGTIEHDPHGLVSHAVNHLYRLLDAPAFRRVMYQHPDADLAVLVSDEVFRAAADDDALDPALYTAMPITCKETRTRAHLWLPPVRRPAR
ncbi:hypothetical protein [Actinomadura harenae]|uniref:Guanylate cyclase domain-containing protein n=1 Tax=Actinomadura harenae TaxID=2483351 RepID=A0A3M2LXB5_9ACTN|nr:hypothetical protein [Actinomadura harenae]RMI42071.1 hypothetical protein EBO15_20675 [Actinomadura harenae]